MRPLYGFREHDLLGEGKKNIKQVEEGEDHGGTGYGHAAIAFGAGVTALLGLALGLQHIEKRKANDGAEYIKDQDRHADHAVDAAEIHNDRRNNTEADDITQ